MNYWSCVGCKRIELRKNAECNECCTVISRNILLLDMSSHQTNDSHLRQMSRVIRKHPIEACKLLWNSTELMRALAEAFDCEQQTRAESRLRYRDGMSFLSQSPGINYTIGTHLPSSSSSSSKRMAPVWSTLLLRMHSCVERVVAFLMSG